MQNPSKVFVTLFCLAILSACQMSWERGDGSGEFGEGRLEERVESVGTGTKVPLEKGDTGGFIETGTGEVIESDPNAYFEKKYRNEKLGIAFLYHGEGKSYIAETGSNVLQYIDYSSDDGIEEYFPSSQDYIEVYEKSSEESFENAVRRIALEQASSLEDCSFEVQEENGTQKMFVKSNEDFVYDESLCTQAEIAEPSPSCHLRQGEDYDKKIKATCSNFASGMSTNYFIYQPQNTKTRIAFLRHTGGMDAPFWELESVELFD